MKLTDATIAKLAFTGKPQFHRVKGCPGLIVSVGATGSTFKYQGSVGGKTTRITLGPTGEHTLAQAAVWADEQRRLCRAGRSPHKPSVAPNTSGCPTVRQAYEWHRERMVRKNAAKFSLWQLDEHLTRFLSPWIDVPLDQLTKAQVVARYEEIWESSGPSTAAHVMRSLRACINTATKRSDATFGNPTSAIDWYKEPPRNNAVPFDQLPDLWAKIEAMPNPTRRLYAKFSLFSGLRPGTAKALERRWVDLPGRKIVVPANAIKTRQEWRMPLSEPMVAILAEALPLHPRNPRIFPIVSHREPSLGHWGYAFRKTFRTVCAAAGLPTEIARHLMAHSVQGIDRHYLDHTQLWPQLLDAQARASAKMLELIAPVGRGQSEAGDRRRSRGRPSPEQDAQSYGE